MPVQTRNTTVRNIAISWGIEAMKTVLGYEDVRNEIIKHYIPQIENPEMMRTFDAFQQYNTPPFIEKEMEITKYCKNIIKDDGIKGLIVMTASNIQESSDDMLTHYQGFIINKRTKHVYVIDPASKDNGNGIYEAAVAKKVILPIFKLNGYTCEFVPLSNPAQTNKGDVFCQTWTVIILLKALYTFNKHNKIDIIDIPSPKPKINKYKLLIDFYKDILIKIPKVSSELKNEYLELINLNKTNISEFCSLSKMQEINVTDLFLSMTPEELME